jgi:sulfonate transport system permease protein
MALLFVWYLVAKAELFRPDQLPPPGRVWDAGVDLAKSGALWDHMLVSTQRVMFGFAIGAALGVGIGAVVGVSRCADVLLGPTIGAVRAVPSLAWVPLLILWLRIGENSKITLIAIGAFFPAYTTVAAALRHVDPNLVEAGRAYGLRGFRLLTGVLLPATTPSVLAGLRLALAQSWLFLVAAELIASSQGLGFLLIDSQNNGRTDRLILAIILLAVMGKLTDAVLGIFERIALRRWA